MAVWFLRQKNYNLDNLNKMFTVIRTKKGNSYLENIKVSLSRPLTKGKADGKLVKEILAGFFAE